MAEHIIWLGSGLVVLGGALILLPGLVLLRPVPMEAKKERKCFCILHEVALVGMTTLIVGALALGLRFLFPAEAMFNR